MEHVTNFITNIIDEDLASGKHAIIKTRFPPEPNGFLHIGHAKSICLNFGIAKDYKGTCNLRFDDTNPEKENIDYVKAIQEDIKWLGFSWDGNVRYSSNYFDKLYNYAVELINKNLAYVCFLTADETREYRGTLTSPGKDSPYRNTSAEENLTLFEKMRHGEFKEGECALRAKIDMSSPFICMRDPVIYRIRFAHHHQTHDKWCIYPMYDFTHCISDAIENITHSLCSLEFQDNRRLYDWILDNLNDFNFPNRTHQYEFSRLNLAYTLMSKRKLQQLVTDKYVTGWDDPRMPTIAGLRRRGYPASSIREFCKRIGVTKQDNTVEVAMLEACVREELNANAPRAMAVIDPIKVIITNYDDSILNLNAPVHPDKEELGVRAITFSRELYIDRADFKEEANKHYKRLVLNKEVRLRNSYMIKAESCDKDDAGNVTTVYCTYDKDTLNKNPADGRKPKGVIHWVDASTAIPATFNIYDKLFNVIDPGSLPLEETINANSLICKHGFVEASLKKPESYAYQFEREGYFCLDKNATDTNLIFNLTVALKEDKPV